MLVVQILVDTMGESAIIASCSIDFPYFRMVFVKNGKNTAALSDGKRVWKVFDAINGRKLRTNRRRAVNLRPTRTSKNEILVEGVATCVSSTADVRS